jgi:predicted dehydrogenase
MGSHELDRRTLIKTAGATLAAMPLARSVLAQDNRTVRCGIVGVGNRGSALLRSTLQVEGVDVPIICDLDASARVTASQAIQKAGQRKPDETEDWKQLLARDDLTAVVAALPCDLHYPMYRDALMAGKHVYGEKPLCLTVEHADALVKLAESTGKVLQVGFQRRFSSQLKQAVKMFKDGVTGPPFDGRGGRFASAMLRKPGEWFSFREKSGDWMLEQAVHNWDVLNWALGELPVSAYGTGRQDLFKELDPQRNVSDYYTATLRYKSGLPYTWVHSWLAPPHPLFTSTYEELIGPKAGIDFSKGFIAYQRGINQGEPTHQIPRVDGEDLNLLALQSFFQCARTGAPPVVGVREGRDATLVGLLVRKAVYDQKLTRMDDVLRDRGR